MSTDAPTLLLLLNWMSPTFPVGSFAYSHGLEQVIADRRTTSEEQLIAWITDLLQCGSGWNDAVLFAQCWHKEPHAVNDLALALASSAERHFETTQLGRAFAAASAVWTGKDTHDDVVAYPVAAGCACKDFGIPREAAMIAFLQGFCAALVSVAVRLVPLGQTAGLRVLKALSPVIASVAEHAGAATLDDLGSATVSADIAAMQHETLQPRIFRT